MTTLKIVENFFDEASRQYLVVEINGGLQLPIDASPTRKGAEAIMAARQFEINRKRMDALK